MTIASVFFFVSLAGIVGMVSAKMFELKRGSRGALSRYLARFDAPLSLFLTRVFATARVLFVFAWQRVSLFLRTFHHTLVSQLHALLQAAERRVRSWREFARTRRIERGSASVFIKDVADYKKQLKQDGGPHHI